MSEKVVGAALILGKPSYLLEAQLRYEIVIHRERNVADRLNAPQIAGASSLTAVAAAQSACCIDIHIVGHYLSPLNILSL